MLSKAYFFLQLAAQKVLDNDIFKRLFTITFDIKCGIYQPPSPGKSSRSAAPAPLSSGRCTAGGNLL